MDDLALLTIGKLYIELTSYQRAVEAQRAKIAELESLINTPAQPKAKDGMETVLRNKT
jgi:hypothetical protein